jgi:hypothetical protein
MVAKKPVKKASGPKVRPGLNVVGCCPVLFLIHRSSSSVTYVA